MSSIEYLEKLSATQRPLGDLSGREVHFDLYSDAIDSSPLVESVGDCFAEVFDGIRRSIVQSGTQV